MALRGGGGGALWLAILIFLLLQVFVWSQANQAKPNPPAAPDVHPVALNMTTVIEDVFNWITVHVNNLVDDMKQNQIYQNVTSALESLARSVKEKGNEVVEKMRNDID